MTPKTDYETPLYDPLSLSSDTHSQSVENVKANLFSDYAINNDADPDTNFFNDKLDDIESPYYSQDELIQLSKHFDAQTFSIFHLNIRSLNKNIENLKNLVSLLKGHFKVIVLSETWCGDTASANSSYQIPN